MKRIGVAKSLHSANKSIKVGLIDEFAKSFKGLVALGQLGIQRGKIDLVDKINTGDILIRGQLDVHRNNTGRK